MASCRARESCFSVGILCEQGPQHLGLNRIVFAYDHGLEIVAAIVSASRQSHVAPTWSRGKHGEEKSGRLSGLHNVHVKEERDGPPVDQVRGRTQLLQLLLDLQEYVLRLSLDSEPSHRVPGPSNPGNEGLSLIIQGDFANQASSGEARRRTIPKASFPKMEFTFSPDFALAHIANPPYWRAFSWGSCSS